MDFLIHLPLSCLFFFIIPPTPTQIHTLSLHDALPISVRSPRSTVRRSFRSRRARCRTATPASRTTSPPIPRSEEHTSELQSRFDLVCRLLLEKKKNKTNNRK